MTKSRIFLLLFIVVATVSLYLLPRYVVNNEQREVVSEPKDQSSSLPQNQSHAHDHDIPDSLAFRIDKFYDSFINADNQEKRLIFADSLAKAYKSVGKLDSMAKYFEIRSVESPSYENLLRAGDGYYNAFNFAVDQSKRNYLAGKAQEYYNRILEEDPDLLDVKAKMAMTYVSGPNPMQGISMLRQVLEKDPNNEMAIYNLGMLSITSGQYEKALQHFGRLSELDPENQEAYFYSGYCLFEMGKIEESETKFQKVLSLGSEGDLAIASEKYLKRWLVLF